MAKDNRDLGQAKNNKNDEFYTLYHDIQTEVNAYLEFNPNVFKGKTILLPCDDPEWSNFTLFFAQNFQHFGLKKLISTSFAQESKKYKTDWQPTLFERENPLFDADKTSVCGKIFVLDRDVTGDGKINIEDLQWEYLEGTGDFRTEEVTRLRDEADIIVTNPPFSMFREFMSWIFEGNKKFLVIGHMNGLKYLEVFPRIQSNQLWLGATNFNTGMYFYVPKGFKYASTYKFEREMNGKAVNRVPGCCWYTNIEHGRRHQPLSLMSEADNIKFSKHKEIRGTGYLRYENYDGIDIPFVDSIPNDYEGVMGVPITFIDKYCPEQFEILGNACNTDWLRSVGVQPMGKDTIDNIRSQGNKAHVTANMPTLYVKNNGLVTLPYARILIRKIQQQ